jgi:FkbM family methyltransferase
MLRCSGFKKHTMTYIQEQSTERAKMHTAGPIGSLGAAHRTLFGIKPYVMKLPDGLGTYIRPRTYDAFIANEIFGQQQYLPHESMDVNEVVTVLDLGANIGLFSLWAIAKYNPKKIICVEPNAKNIELLQKNLELNQVESIVEIVEGAVGDRPGVMNLHNMPFNRGANYLTDQDGGQTVVTCPLATIMQGERIDYLKMDIEGSERFVITDPNRPVFGSQIGYLNMELHKNSGLSMGRVAAYFALLDYKVLPHPHGAYSGVLGMFEATKTR